MTPVPAETVWTMELLNSMPVEVKEIQAETRSDSTLAVVLKFVQCGWPSRNTDKALKPYLSRKEELRIQDGCLLWGSPVVVPPKARERVMEELHETHPGICRMKSLARSCIWWAKIDSDLEMKVRNCEVCQVNRKLPLQAPLYPWIRLQLNYGGPFVDKMFLIVIDAHSKWLEAFPMNTSTTSANIEKLRIIEFDPWTSRNGSYRQRQQLCEQRVRRFPETESAMSELHPIIPHQRGWQKELSKHSYFVLVQALFEQKGGNLPIGCLSRPRFDRRNKKMSAQTSGGKDTPLVMLCSLAFL